MKKQRWEESEKRGEEERRSEKRKSQIKADAGVRKGSKVAIHCLFQWFVAPEGRKVGSLKRRVRCHLARWEVNKCTPFWREAHFEVKMQSTTCPEHFSKKKCTPLWRDAHLEVTSAFRKWDVQKVHVVVVRSTFRSQNAQNAAVSEHFWQLRCSKSARRYGAKSAFGGEHAKDNVATCFVWQEQGILHWAKRGRRGTSFVEDLQRCISRGRRGTRGTWARHVRRPRRWFPEKGCIFEHQIFLFAKMILRDRCSASCGLASLFRGRRSTLETWTGKIAKRIGTRPSALHSTFHFWRKSHRIASFLMLSTLSTWKIEDVSQNCCVFDVAQVKDWRSHAVFKLADRWIDRKIDRQTHR